MPIYKSKAVIVKFTTINQLKNWVVGTFVKAALSIDGTIIQNK